MKKALFKLQSARSVYKQQQNFSLVKKKTTLKKILQNILFTLNQISHAALEF